MQHASDEPARLIGRLLNDATDEQRKKLCDYIALVAEYSQVLNLTGFGADTAALAGELVGEAVRLHNLAPVRDGWAVIDMGSGNGSPVIPLAVLNPQARFTAVESRQKRATFLARVQARLALDNLQIHAGRVESVAKTHAHSFNLVTSRAFAPPTRLLPVALSLLLTGGEIRGFFGEDSGTLTETASALGLEVVDFISYAAKTSRRHVYRLRYWADSRTGRP